MQGQWQINPIAVDRLVRVDVFVDAIRAGRAVDDRPARGVTAGNQSVQQDQTALADLVPAFESFRVRPFSRQCVQHFQGRCKFVADAQGFKLAVEHQACRVMHPCPPRVLHRT